MSGEKMIQKFQEKVQAATSVATPTGAGVAGVGALTFNEWLALGGFLLALGGFVINWYYQHKRYELMKQDIENDKT